MTHMNHIQINEVSTKLAQNDQNYPFLLKENLKHRLAISLWSTCLPRPGNVLFFIVHQIGLNCNIY